MAAPRNSTIFSPVDVSLASTASFHSFGSLPPELRIKIWRLSLHRQRIIKICLQPRFLTTALAEQQGTSRPATHEHETYGAVVEGFRVISKLFHVNRESRAAALDFYRVHVSCWLNEGRTKSDKLIPGYLYLNPEHDFLWITHIQGGSVAQFWHDLKVLYDPRGVGLLNILMETNELMTEHRPGAIDVSALDPVIRKSFIEILTQLRQVWFPKFQPSGRHVFGLRVAAPTNENLVNLSIPLVTRALHFDEPRREPRPIGLQLGKVLLYSDPRENIQEWRRFVTKSIGTRESRTEYHVLLSCEPSSAHKISDRLEGEAWLEREKEIWVADAQWDGDRGQPLRDAEATTQTAFGFWLFSATAFGKLPDDPNEEFEVQRHQWMDFREHWPDLALTDLP